MFLAEKRHTDTEIFSDTAFFSLICRRRAFNTVAGMEPVSDCADRTEHHKPDIMPMKSSLLKTLLRLTIPLALIAVLIPLFMRRPNNDDAESVEYRTGRAADLGPVPVEAEAAFTGDLIMRVEATGIARAARCVDLKPRAGGRVTELPHGEGEPVRKGELILKLDDTEARLALQEAEQSLASARAKFVDLLLGHRNTLIPEDTTLQKDPNIWYLQYTRKEAEKAQKRFDEGKISSHDLEQARLWHESAGAFLSQRREALLATQSGLTGAYLAWKRALYEWEQTTLPAPFSGILGNQAVQVDQIVSAGQTCFTLVDLSSLRVEAHILESEVSGIRTGRKAEVRFSAFPLHPCAGLITAVNPLVDPDTKTCRVTVKISNPENRFRDGMFAYVSLEGSIYNERFLVPREAILVRDDRELLFIVRDGTAKWSYVDTGLRNENYVEILGSVMGLEPGEPVITRGHYTLIHDAPVTVTNNPQ